MILTLQGRLKKAMTTTASSIGARRCVNRLARLRRRLNNIRRTSNSNQLGEISALEWAIPILESYITETFNMVPPERYPMYKHQKQSVVNRLLAEEGNYCYLCGMPLQPNDITIDHIKPLSRGGEDAYYNYALTHMECNLRKGAMTEDEYKEKYG
jgi:5-methylcytosine-specific restriction endonuclease McrA